MSFFRKLRDKVGSVGSVGITQAEEKEENASDRDDSSTPGSIDTTIGRSAYGDEESDPDLELRRLNYYHGFLPRSDAEDILTKSGDFLVRKSDKGGTQQVILSIQISENDQYSHLAVPRNPTNQFWIISDKLEVPSLDTYLLQLQKSGQPLDTANGTVLRHAVPRQAWQLRHSQIIRDKMVGSGAFGEVYRGWLKLDDERSKECAIKCLPANAVVTKESREEFIAESRIIRRLHHENIIKFRGIAIDEEPLMMVLEWAANGALVDILKKRGGEITNADKTLFSVQAAQGLRYLEKNKVIHRDVAARNCLLDADMRCKIADFGLSLMANKVNDLENVKVPIKWLAPETLSNQVFSHKTDVYAFGILIWEIFSNGREPFSDMRIKDVVQGVIRHGLTLSSPKGIPENMDKIMKNCWDRDPNQRPTFLQLKKQLRKEYDSLAKKNSTFLSRLRRKSGNY